MCPTWGVVHAQRKYQSDARSMALECGSLMHEVFGAVRVWQLGEGAEAATPRSSYGASSVQVG